MLTGYLPLFAFLSVGVVAGGRETNPQPHCCPLARVVPADAGQTRTRAGFRPAGHERQEYRHLNAIPIILGSALLALAAAPAGAQVAKEMLTNDPGVVRSLEPNPAPQGTRSPDTIDETDEESGLQGALEHLKEDPVDVEGNDVERRSRDSSQPPQPPESPESMEDRADVPDANEPGEQSR